MKRQSAVLSLLVAAVLAWAGPAHAVSYGSFENPVKASDNSDDGNAWFWGNVTAEDHAAMRHGYYYRDSDRDQNQVYVQTDWYYLASSGAYRSAGQDQSPRSTDYTWIHGTDLDDLRADATRARAVAKVCEDQPFSPDPCSRDVVVTLGY